MKSFGRTSYANETFPAALPHLILVLAHFTEKIFFCIPQNNIWSLRRLNLRLLSAM